MQQEKHDTGASGMCAVICPHPDNANKNSATNLGRMQLPSPHTASPEAMQRGSDDSAQAAYLPSMLSLRQTAVSLVSKSTYGMPIVIFRGPLVPITFMWYCTTASSARPPAAIELPSLLCAMLLGWPSAVEASSERPDAGRPCVRAARRLSFSPLL